MVDEKQQVLVSKHQEEHFTPKDADEDQKMNGKGMF